jgi:hypothetical protein
MKKQFLFRMMVLIAVLSIQVVFTACQKSEETQTFDDVFNTANIQVLNELVVNSGTLSDLPAEFSEINLEVPEALNNILISDLISAMEQKVKISNSEVDLLLQNDITTYSNIVDRIGGLTIDMEVLNNAFTEVQSSSLNKYLLIQKQELNQYYEDDYYHSILELQNYMEDFVIKPLKNINKLAEKTEILKSATADKTKDDKTKKSVVVVILKNKKDMDDKYEKDKKDKKEKKHKGSKGNNGNHNGHDD